MIDKETLQTLLTGNKQISEKLSGNEYDISRQNRMNYVMLCENKALIDLFDTIVNNWYKGEFGEKKIFDSPIKVFKYRTWRSSKENEKKHDKVIEKLELHFATPEKFDDINDCRCRVNYISLLTDLNLQKTFIIKITIEELLWLNRDKFFDFSENKISRKTINKIICDLFPYFIDRYIKFINKRGDFNWEYILDFYNNEWKLYCEKTGVLSLTNNPRGLKLWEGYTNNFEGICYGFDADKLGCYIKDQCLYDFKAKDVIYEDELEKISPFANQDVKVYKRSFQKLKIKYAWEEESRITIMEEKDEIQRNKKFSIDCLTEIIFGYKMTKENFEEFIKVLDGHQGQNVPLFVAKLHGGNVEIEHLIGRKYWN